MGPRPRAIFRAIVGLSSTSSRPPSSSCWRAAAAPRCQPPTSPRSLGTTHPGAPFDRVFTSETSSNKHDNHRDNTHNDYGRLIRSGVGDVGGGGVGGGGGGAPRLLPSQLRHVRAYAQVRGGGGGRSDNAFAGAANDDNDERVRQGPAHRINEKITARQIRLVHASDGADSDEGDEEGGGAKPGGDGANPGGGGKSHEVMPTIVALRRAREANLDLVEVNPRAVPPVCRLMVRHTATQSDHTVRGCNRSASRVGASRVSTPPRTRPPH